MRKHWLAIAGLWMVLGAAAQTRSAQHSPLLTPGIPESVGMSTERLARIDRMCREAVHTGEVPGIVALVARNGRIVFHEAYGMADNDAGVPMQRDAIFRIASQTKAITSTAVMMLWEEGRFRLDDPISNFIPEFKNPVVLDNYNSADGSFTVTPARSEITIRHLLTHTSGIGYGEIDNDKQFRDIYRKAGITDLFTTEKITIGESVRKLARLPLHHHPGERFTYGESLDVLAYFIEVVSGLPFDRFLRERLFEPLGMEDTWFYLPPGKEQRLVTVQYPVNGAWKPYPITFYDPAYPVKGARSFFSGGAGLCSSARDYATFLQMYLNGGELNGIRILSRTTVQTILENQVGDLFGSPDRRHGLAFGVWTEGAVRQGGEGSAGTFDWGGYFNTQYFADPVEKTIGILMKQTQNATGDQTYWKFRLLTGQAIDD